MREYGTSDGIMLAIIAIAAAAVMPYRCFNWPKRLAAIAGASQPKPMSVTTVLYYSDNPPINPLPPPLLIPTPMSPPPKSDPSAIPMVALAIAPNRWLIENVNHNQWWLYPSRSVLMLWSLKSSIGRQTANDCAQSAATLLQRCPLAIEVRHSAFPNTHD